MKYLQQIFDMDIAMNGQLDGPYTDSSTAASYPGGYGRWLCLGITPNDLTSTRSLFSSPSGTGGYNTSAFALVIPQGVGTQERIGRDVSVMRDEFFFRLSFPLALPQVDAEQANTTSTVSRLLPYWTDSAATAASNFLAGHRFPNANVGQRPMRVRLVGIHQNVLDRPGEFGFLPSELFNSVNEITSRFNKHDARGYRIVYDKTKSLYPQPGYLSNYGVAPQASPARQSAQKFDVSFSCSLPPYLRRYEAADAPDNVGGSEILLSGITPTAGVSIGATTWYLFVEDEFCSRENSGGASSTSGASFHEYHPQFLKLELNRKTLWTDG